jgi:hypothetical protein
MCLRASCGNPCVRGEEARLSVAKPGPLASFASRRGKTRAHAWQDLLVREHRLGG